MKIVHGQLLCETCQFLTCVMNDIFNALFNRAYTSYKAKEFAIEIYLLKIF